MKRLALIAILGACAAQADSATVAVRGGSAFVRGHPDRDRWAATVGLEGLWRQGWLLLGGAVDASSRVNSLTSGTVRHIFVAGEGGASIDLPHHLRFDLIGELGAHRLSGSRSGPFRLSPDSGSDADSVDVWLGSDPVWAPFVGARPSVQLLFTRVAIGIAAWGRADLIALNPPLFLEPEPFPAQGVRTSLGRFSAGADLHLAVRFQ